jgi:hypothetical protein
MNPDDPLPEAKPAPMFATVDKGDVIDVVPKNPFTSTATWGLIVAGITYFAGFGARKGWWPATLNDLIRDAALEQIGVAIGIAVAAYGRWKATRPLGFGTRVNKVVK